MAKKREVLGEEAQFGTSLAAIPSRSSSKDVNEHNVHPSFASPRISVLSCRKCSFQRRAASGQIKRPSQRRSGLENLAQLLWTRVLVDRRPVGKRTSHTCSIEKRQLSRRPEQRQLSNEGDLADKLNVSLGRHLVVSHDRQLGQITLDELS